ncbi:TPA: hypothetical protein EYP66_04815 [Candidatus Poribacteria bacterium]|nr:hypothetical protein [Candidatus Poribacteria bacterium]
MEHQSPFTPPVGIPQRGYASRRDVFQGIHDDLYAKALVPASGKFAKASAAIDVSLLTAVSKFVRLATWTRLWVKWITASMS